ncbi:hypothetical protein [Arthrobacter sp. ISL-28]|uniref:hypothetical protein n=1 Tax=Arthrobacter sp. ISL-28 TaxID=2819108 RepID=UPI001BEB08F3|nr:hypothetical protein [Arthrobacter sp. ISL-28]MBT2521859.1 hypothetical protein [Arthrobacter sp. ISL-28]
MRGPAPGRAPRFAAGLVETWLRANTARHHQVPEPVRRRGRAHRGPISTFTDIASLKPVPMPEKRPADLKRKWKIVGMSTDKGPLQLASDETALRLLESGWS